MLNPEFCPMPLTQMRKKSRCNLSYALAGAGVTKNVQLGELPGKVLNSPGLSPLFSCSLPNIVKETLDSGCGMEASCQARKKKKKRV